MRRMPERRLDRISLFFINQIITPTFILLLKGRVGVKNILKNKGAYFKEDFEFRKGFVG
jgi:hypothetical protein